MPTTAPTDRVFPCVNGPRAYTAPMPVKQIAALLQVHRNTASRYLTTGQVRAKRVGGRWRLHVDELPADYERLPQMA